MPESGASVAGSAFGPMPVPVCERWRAQRPALGLMLPATREGRGIVMRPCDVADRSPPCDGGGGHVHSVDISGEMLRIAERKAAEQKTDNVTFHRANVDTLTSCEAASFDCVCAFNIIHLVDDPPVFLRRIFEILRPGGSPLSTTPCLGESPMPDGVIIKTMRWLGKAPAVDILKIADLDASLRSAGFVDLTSPDVGAAKQTAFILARKPA